MRRTQSCHGAEEADEHLVARHGAFDIALDRQSHPERVKTDTGLHRRQGRTKCEALRQIGDELTEHPIAGRLALPVPLGESRIAPGMELQFDREQWVLLFEPDHRRPEVGRRRHRDGADEQFAGASLAQFVQLVAERRNRIVGKSSIDVTLSELSVTVDGSEAKARFRQAYRAGSFAVTSRKTLEMTKVKNQWVIVKETTGN